MACCINKSQKRKDIADACKELFINEHHNDITMSQIALTAGIGKGTIYEYFANKEDIVFELMSTLMEASDILMTTKIAKATSTKEKIKVFFEFFYDDQRFELRSIYKEFISISLQNSNSKVIDFQTKCHTNYHAWLREIIQEGVNSGELVPQTLQLINGLFAFASGMFITKSITNTMDDLEKEINDFVDTLFTLIQK